MDGDDNVAIPPVAIELVSFYCVLHSIYTYRLVNKKAHHFKISGFTEHGE